MYNLAQHQPEFEKIIEHLKKELSTIHTGRATPAMVENIKVESYGTFTSLPQLASISSPEASQLLIEPWDKSIIKGIEKALRENTKNLGVNNEGLQIRLTLPQMTEETRKELVKVLGLKLENSKITARGLRDKIKEEIVNKEKNKEISEDDKYNFIEKLDELTRQTTDKINEAGQKKEAEIQV